MLKSFLKKQKEEAARSEVKAPKESKSRPSKDKPENSDSDTDDDIDFKNLAVKKPVAAPRRRSSLDPGSPASPGAPRQRRQSFDAGANAAMVRDAMADVNQVLAAEPKARARRGSIS
jgi:hypothetical protein